MVIIARVNIIAHYMWNKRMLSLRVITLYFAIAWCRVFALLSSPHGTLRPAIYFAYTIFQRTTTQFCEPRRIRTFSYVLSTFRDYADYFTLFILFVFGSGNNLSDHFHWRITEEFVLNFISAFYNNFCYYKFTFTAQTNSL